VSAFWTAFIVVGAFGSLIAMLLLLWNNRQATEATIDHEFDGIREYDNPLPPWWVWFFVGTVAFAAVYLLYYPGLGSFAGLGNWTSASELAADATEHDERVAPIYERLRALSPVELATDPQARQVGRRLFLNRCASCHGTDARGAFGFPNLADDEWMWGGDLAAIEATIASGRDGAMPGWGAALGERGVTDMAHYVLSLSGQPHDSAAAARAAPQYTTFCVACHGADGRGSTAFGAPDLGNGAFLYGASLDEVAFTIRHGRSGHMPPQSSLLSADEIRILATYVHTLGGDS
jgi:cytochrome c oxidase cbb3-type subunit 3